MATWISAIVAAAIVLAANSSFISAKRTDSIPNNRESLFFQTDKAPGSSSSSFLSLISKYPDAHRSKENVAARSADSAHAAFNRRPRRETLPPCPPETIRRKRAARHLYAAKWPGGVVPFQFAPDMDAWQRHLVRHTMAIWERGTCVRFREWPMAFNRIYIRGSMNTCFSVEGRYRCCSSEVGMTGGRQYLYLGNGCWNTRNIAHELGHALGLGHEHQRPDRSSFIEIIDASAKPCAYRIDHSLVPLTTYDVHSVMHYGAIAHGQIRTKDWRMQQAIGSIVPSLMDFAAINQMYCKRPLFRH